MKTLVKICLFSAAFGLVFTLTNCNRLGVKSKTVTEAFNIDFTGSYIFVGPDTLANSKCTDSIYAVRVIVDCNGTGSHLGSFTANFDFCVDEEGHYGNTDAFLVASGGDTLYLSCAGQVMEGRLDDHEAHVISYWRDPFEITGGTGQFKGATGGGTTNDYNSSLDANSHHHWSGNITLIKGEK